MLNFCGFHLLFTTDHHLKSYGTYKSFVAVFLVKYCQEHLHFLAFFAAKIVTLLHIIPLYFNVSLTSDTVNFEQLGSEIQYIHLHSWLIC